MCHVVFHNSTHGSLIALGVHIVHAHTHAYVCVCVHTSQKNISARQRISHAVLHDFAHSILIIVGAHIMHQKCASGWREFLHSLLYTCNCVKIRAAVTLGM